MKWADMKVGETYRGRGKKAHITRTIVRREYNEWLNDDHIFYTTSLRKGEYVCMGRIFVGWAEK